MNELLDKLQDYKKIANFTVKYKFETDLQIEFKYTSRDFPHLIGLHKLIDIPVIRQFNDRSNMTVSAKYITSKIKKEKLLTEETVKNSSYFNVIEERYNKFSSDNLLKLSYTDVVIDFDPRLIGSSLNAKYILYDKESNGYNHLCVAVDSKNKNYPESFFFNERDIYLKNQSVIKIKEMQVFDNKGVLFLSDNF